MRRNQARPDQTRLGYQTRAEQTSPHAAWLTSRPAAMLPRPLYLNIRRLAAQGIRASVTAKLKPGVPRAKRWRYPEGNLSTLHNSV